MTKSILFFFIVGIIATSSTFANYNTPGTGVKWNLNDLVANSGGNVTFSSGMYNVNDTVYILPNDTLAITADATVKFIVGSYFDVNGVLIINPPTGVTFTAQNTAAGYLGLRIDSSNASVIRKLTLEYAVSLRLLDSSPIIDSCVFQYNNNVSFSFGNGAIALFRSSPSITNSKFINNYRGAIQSGFDNNNAPKIIGNLFMGNNNTTSSLPQVNLSSTGADTLKILNNQFLRASIYSGGISLFASAVTNAVISGNVIKNNRYGINVQGASNMNVLISYNVIDSNNTQNDPNLGGSGIAFAGGTATSHQNSIVTGNLLRWNLWGITIQNAAQPNVGNLTNADTTDDGKNQFIDNFNVSRGYLDLFNRTSDNISAQNNYWNTNDPAQIETKIFHRVDSAALGLVNFTNYILPVELTNLTLTTNRNNATLNWQTKTENNSDHFVIEKSDDGRKYSDAGKVAAAGASTSTRSYTFSDNNIFVNNRTVYYRLKLVDKDNRFKYSNVVTARLANANAEVVKLYPTVLKSSQNLNAEIVSDKDQPVNVQFRNADGKLLAQTTKTLFAGNNFFTLTNNSLPSGLIYVRFVAHNIDQTIRVLNSK